MLDAALTWWNGHVRTLGHDAAYAMTWEIFKKKLTDKYCPKGEIKKLEIELWNLKVKGNDVDGYTQRFQELALMCTKFLSDETEKVDKYISGLLDNIHGNVMSVRPKTLDFAIELANDLINQKLRSGGKKPYEGSKPLCPKCNYHHDGECAPKCTSCKKVGYLTKDCWHPINANNQRTITCYECGNQGHYRSDCPMSKNQANSVCIVSRAPITLLASYSLLPHYIIKSYMADDEVPTNMALMAFSDSGVYNDKTCLKTCLKSIETLKTQLANLRIEFNKFEFNLATYKRGSQIPDKSRKGVGFVSYNVIPPPSAGLFSPLKLDLSNSGLEEFQQPEFKGYVPKTSYSVSEDIYNKVKESLDTPLVKKLVLDEELEKKTIFPTVTKIEFVRPKQQEKLVRKQDEYVKMYRSQSHRERVVSWNNYTRVNYNYSTRKTYPNAHRNMATRAVLMKTGLRPLNITWPVNTAHPKTIVYSARRISCFSKLAQSTGHPQKEDQGYVDSRFSRHMTGNMSNLSDFKEFDAGYVTFGGGSKGGKISGKGTLKTGKLDFEDVYFFKELQFNLFTVSHMCDKKNSVLFTDTGCFVLSPNFKLANKSQVLIKVPRKNNMYSVDMKNIVSKESLTYLVANATLDESMLWHRRLGHINFKNINKLVKENLVRGLPTKSFENDQTYVACLKGKQHKASSKDETSGILKSFITEIENLVDKKVKIIRCDNGSEFKNKVMRKFNGKFNDGFFVGYSLNGKDFRVYNIRTRIVEENLHIRFLENKPIIAGTNSNDFVGTEESIGTSHASKETRSSKDYIFDTGKKNDDGVTKESGINDQERPENSTQDVNIVGPSINTVSTNVNIGSLNINNVSPSVTTAPLEATYADLFGDETESSVQTRRMTKTSSEQGFISAVYEGKTHKDLHTCLFAYFLSREEPKKVFQALKDPNWIEAMAIGTKWIYRNQKDERGIVVRNKARLVAQGHTQEEGIDYDKMDVKSAFLYGKIEEEVYFCLPPRFEYPEFPDRVYKVEKALYGLYQAPRAWKEMCTEFEKMTHKKFHMSYIGELTFFLGLQVTQNDDGIFISQDKYVDDILKKFGFSTVKTASTPMETSKSLLKDAEAEDVDVHLYRSMIGSLMYLTASRRDIMFVYPKDSPFNLEAYIDSDYASTSLDIKSTIGGCQFLRSRLISWQCKKQTVVANSTIEAEYVAISSCCGQVLWIQNQILDYGYNFMNTKIFIDNESTICIVKNLVFYSKTKHNEIRHHFIRDSNEKKLIQMIKIHTDQNVAYLLTKAFDVGRFQNLVASIGMLNL
nr:hypothetical protein [Tanacetum cinerariifolium]